MNFLCIERLFMLFDCKAMYYTQIIIRVIADELSDSIVDICKNIIVIIGIKKLVRYEEY